MAEDNPKPQKYHYVYEITNIYNGMRYFGARSSKVPPHLDTKYMSSSPTLKAAIKEEGLSHFSKLILAVFPTREKALAHEVFLHKRFDVDKDPTFYNKAKQTSTGFYFQACGQDHPMYGTHPKGRKLTEEEKEKLQQAARLFNTGRKFSEERRKKLSEVRKGKRTGSEAPMYGKHHTEETKKIIGSRTRKKIQPIETRKAISLANSGENNAQFGKVFSQEERDKLSEQLKNRTRYLYVTPVGEFASASAAGRELQCSGFTIIKRCKDEFEGYSLKPVTENKKEEFKKLYEEGMIIWEIEKLLNVDNSTVHRWRKELGLEKRKRRYSLETRKNQSSFRTGEGNPLYGKPMTQEHKNKISEGWRKHVQSIFITPAGEFNTAVDAGKALQCSSSTITRWCKEGTEGYYMKPARDKKAEFKDLYEKGLKLTEIAVILEIHKNTAGAWKRDLPLSPPTTIDPDWKKNYCC